MSAEQEASKTSGLEATSNITGSQETQTPQNSRFQALNAIIKLKRPGLLHTPRTNKSFMGLTFK